jgi:FSR family fosmidomycin resistance protein-like MFS transporter
LTVTHTANDAFANILPALLPLLQLRFGLSETMLAVLVATISLSSNVLQPLFGALSDRLGRRLVGALGIVACSGLMSLIGVAPNPWVLFGLLLVGGLGSAAFHPAAGSMIRGAQARGSGFGISLFMAGGPIGSAIGPVAVLFVIAQYGIGYTPLLMIPGVVLGLLVYLLVPAQTRASKEARPKLFDAALFFGPVGLLGLVGILRSMAYVTFLNAFPLHLVHAHGIARDAVLIGWTLAVFNASAAVGGIAATLLAARFGRLPVVIGSMLLALPCLLGIFWLSPGTLPYFLLVGLAGMLTNAAIPLLIVSAQDLAPHAVATASGMLMGMTWGTAGLLYIGIGGLQEAIGIAPAMSVGYAFMLPAAALAYYTFRRYVPAYASSSR